MTGKIETIPHLNNTDRQTLQQIVSKILSLASPQKIVLFGSRARGDHNEKSDFDLAVFQPDPNRWANAYVSLLEHSPTLKKIDLVNFSEVGLELQKRIIQEGIVLYEQSNN